MVVTGFGKKVQAPPPLTEAPQQEKLHDLVQTVRQQELARRSAEAEPSAPSLWRDVLYLVLIFCVVFFACIGGLVVLSIGGELQN